MCVVNGISPLPLIHENALLPMLVKSKDVFLWLMQKRDSMVGSGAHGQVVQLRCLEHRLKCSVFKKSVGEIPRLQEFLRSGVDLDCLPQFLAEMLCAALLSSVFDLGLSPHFLRCGPFVSCGNYAGYALEQVLPPHQEQSVMLGDLGLFLQRVRPMQPRIGEADITAVMLQVEHLICTYQECFEMTHNDLSCKNLLLQSVNEIVFRGMRLDEVQWFRHWLPCGQRSFLLPNLGFLVRMCDPGVAVVGGVRFDKSMSFRRARISCRDIGDNRRPLASLRDLHVGQRIRFIPRQQRHSSPIDGIVDKIDGERISVKLGAFFQPAETFSEIMTITLHDTAVFGIQPGMESFGIHRGFQPGYDFHFFFTNFLQVVVPPVLRRQHPRIRLLLEEIHPFETVDTCEDLPQSIRETGRPLFTNIFPLSVREMWTEHPELLENLPFGKPCSGDVIMDIFCQVNHKK
jgi:hypothetical protein